MYRCLALLAIVLTAGCGGGSAAPATGQRPASTDAARTWQPYRPTGADYQLELPGEWQTLDNATVQQSGGIDQLTRRNPELANIGQTLRTRLSTPGTMLAVDGSEPGKASVRATGFVTNILALRNDTHVTIADAQILKRVAAAMARQMESIALGGTSRRNANATLGDLPAAWLQYRLALDAGAGRVVVTERDYVTAQDGVVYQLSCTAPTGRWSQLEPLCEHVAASFRTG